MNGHDFVGLMRPHGVEEAIAWVKETRSLDIVAGYDLQGDEVGWPAAHFQPALDLARAAGKRVKVHAGEMTGPESIRISVEHMGITQVGHGTCKDSGGYAAKGVSSSAEV